MCTNFRKMLSLALAVLLTAGSMSACASNEGQAGESSQASNSSSSSVENSNDASSDGNQDFTAEVSTYSITCPLFTNLPTIEGEELYEMLTEQTGVAWDATWISSSDYTTKFQTLLASRDLPDVLVSTNLLDTSLSQAIDEGCFRDLSGFLGDFSQYPNLVNNSTPNAFNYVKKSDGAIYGVPRSRAQLEMCIFMRKDWMDKYGYDVEDIKTVWDWKDCIVDIASKDPDGNGVNDTMGFAAHDYSLGSSYVVDMMCSAFGAYNRQTDEDGGLYYPQLTDGFMDYVEFAHELYEEGAISKEFAVLKNTDADEMFKNGLAVSFCRTGPYAWSYENNLKQNMGIEDAEIIALPYLKGTDDNTTAVQTTGVYGAYHLNAQLDDYDIQKLLNFYEKTCNEEWHTYAFYGLEGRDYEVDDTGWKVATDYGITNEGNFKSLQQIVTTIANDDMKLISTSGTKEFNDKIIASALTYLEPEANIKINPFRAVDSASWGKVWPLYQNTFETNTANTIAGLMSMDDYRKYVTQLREQDDMKACWQEFAESDKVLFG